MATRTTKRLVELSGEELGELVTLIGGSDSVELKVTLPVSEHRATVRALELDPLDAQIRQVFFFDTPELALYKSGVAVRARRVQGRNGDTVVKLRPIKPDDLPEDVRRSASMNVEVDAMPGGYVCSASMKGKAPNAEVRAAIQGERPVSKLFSKEQRAFFAEHAPDGVKLNQLSILGPVFVLKETIVPRKYGRRMVAEVWLLPNGQRILELSTKCQPSEAFQVGLETRAYLEGLGLELNVDPQTKTKATLGFFSRRLLKAAKDAAAEEPRAT
jgi:hypothetical protein